MSKRRRSNTGIPGLSFSWRRATGVSTVKRRIARATGIPVTRSSRRAKAGRMMGCLLPILGALALLGAMAALLL